MLGGKKSGERTVPPRGTGNEAVTSIIGPEMSIVGDVSTDGTVRVEGRIEGTVRAGKTVIIASGGQVMGDVVTQDAVIGGTVRGTVVAESRLELLATCDIEGQIRALAKHLKLEEGCRFSGQVQMLDGGESLALPAPARVENSTELQGLSTP
ncbi:MAG: polymer-forming cytoskeletal protein [Gemmatimonadetes bacterium]|nr:polymer-forming cytoskeletal protein [Gemmatimonadota bacterium]